MPSAPIPTNDAARLSALYKYSILDTVPEQAFEDIVKLATYICGTPTSVISLVDRDRQWFKARVNVALDQTPRTQSFCAHTLSKPEILVVEDARLDPRFADNPLVLGHPGIRFYAGAPLIDPNGLVLGTVCVIDTKPRVLSQDQIDALESLSRHVMLLLESRLRLIEKEKATKALIQSEKLAAVGRLASTMAHELNNPLEAVTNLLFLARQNAQNQQVIEWLAQADQELRRISIVASQTLRFHKQVSKPQAVTCNSLFSATLTVYESRLKNSGISIEKRKRATAPVRCFEGDLRHVLSNVITNAIDAMPAGGRIMLRSRQGTDWTTGRKGLVLTIADTGAGIDNISQHRLFEAFYSTKGIGGSGLGLWISAEIMDRHQGRIAIRSSQQTGHCGTVVTLFLPLDATLKEDSVHADD